VIGFLRFVGLMNAAVWFGAAVFYTFGAGPSLASSGLKDVIGTNNSPYFGFLIENMVGRSFWHLYLACSVVALLYMAAEWLYFGKYPSRWWLAFVFALVLVGTFQGFWIQPTLKSLHESEHNRQVRVEERQLAARSFTTWNAISRYLDLVLAASLGFYTWRVANPSDPMRFVGSAKFRG